MDQQLFEAAVAAIVDTAREGFFEGYRNAEHWSVEVSPEELADAWHNSETYAAVLKMVSTLTGHKL